MPDSSLAPVCGIYCGACEHLGRQCRGCGAVEGRPFWVAQVNVAVCPLYDCCINGKQLEHCGLCDELPCKTFVELRDPSLSDEEAERALVERRDGLLRRKNIGTDKWLQEKQARTGKGSG